MIEFLLWVAVALLGYIYLGYPVVIGLLARVRPRPVRKSAYTGTFSVVIAAYNEAGVLPRKIENLLRSDCAGQISEIVIASDGSTDGTKLVAQAVTDPRIRVVEFAERQGKPSVLNDIVPKCRSNIVVLTDARQEIAANTLSELLANFADEQVGVVSGELVFRDEHWNAATSGIGSYWRYEKFIRRSESLFASVPGATGALYAIRKWLFHPIPAGALLDDVAIPMQAVVEGRRCVFEEHAVVYDRPSASVRAETIRKRRTIAGTAQLMRLYPSWLSPWKNPIWFQFVSHKLGRLLSPFLLILVFALNFSLLQQRLYAALYVVQAAFYGAALFGHLVARARGWWARIPGVATVFVSLNFTTLLAVVDAARGRFNVRWERSAGDGHR